MVEAGWSPIVYDYADRYQSFGEVVIFFVCIHICIVIIGVSLMKGMAADFYETIYKKYEEVLRIDLDMLEKEDQEE
jgi:ABC-type lipoprotein release transport system permease subunit